MAVIIINNKKQSVVPTIRSILDGGVGIGTAVEHEVLTVGI